MSKLTFRSQLRSVVVIISASPRRFAPTVRTLIVLSVVAGAMAGVPASPAWATPTDCSEGGSFTITDNVVSAGSTCMGTATLPAGVTSIGFDAFKDASLTRVTFANDSALLTIRDRAFDGSGLTSIEIPKSVTSIGEFAFASTSALVSVTFEEDSALATIDTGAFTNMGLRSVVIPRSVTTIGNFAFKDNLFLTSVRFEGDKPAVLFGAQVFTNVASGATVTVGPTATGFEPVDSAGLWEGLVLVFFPLVPSFDAPSVTADGFTVQISNYDAAFSWVTTVTTGSVVVGGTGLVTVSGVAAGMSSTVTVTAKRSGYADGTADISGTSMSAAVDPTVNSVSRLKLVCDASPPQFVRGVTCTVTGGDPGIEILWRAAHNPVFAEAGVTLDATGSGTFSFTVPAAALGDPVTVELVEWLAPISLGVAGGPVPTSVPSGEGPVPMWSLVMLVLAGGLALRRMSAVGVRG